MINIMPRSPIKPADSLANNLRILMKIEQLDQVVLAKRAGVSQKTISNLLNARTSPNLDKIDAVAAAFNLNLWQLLMPGLPNELVSDGILETLYASFILADAKGRNYVLHVADREAEYKVKNLA